MRRRLFEATSGNISRFIRSARASISRASDHIQLLGPSIRRPQGFASPARARTMNARSAQDRAMRRLEERSRLSTHPSNLG